MALSVRQPFNGQAQVWQAQKYIAENCGGGDKDHEIQVGTIEKLFGCKRKFISKPATYQAAITGNHQVCPQQESNEIPLQILLVIKSVSLQQAHKITKCLTGAKPCCSCCSSI